MKAVIPLTIAILYLGVAGCDKTNDGPEGHLLIMDFNDDLVLSDDAEVVVRIGEKVIKAGGQLELGGDWEYLRKSSEEPFTGLLVSYHENGSFSTRGAIKNGRNHGLYESFQEDESVSSRFSYLEGEFHGFYETFHDNGQIEVKGSYEYGKSEGAWELYRDDGTLEVLENWEDGKYHGPYFKYSLDGQLTDQECYRNNEIVDFTMCET